jgi:hypothetical protein
MALGVDVRVRRHGGEGGLFSSVCSGAAGIIVGWQ